MDNIEITRLNIERYRRLLDTELNQVAREALQKHLGEFEERLRYQENAARHAVAGCSSQPELVAREMQHRLRNAAALVQAIIRQTLRGKITKEQAERVITERLTALAHANDLFITEDKDATSLRAVVRRVLDIYDDPKRARFQIDGPDLSLDQRTGLGLALILHEMATNASKYGALSKDGGHVELQWKLLNCIHLHWAEHDGPSIHQPFHEGLGTRLIHDALRGTGATVELSFPTTGATLDIEIPLPSAQQANLSLAAPRMVMDRALYQRASPEKTSGSIASRPWRRPRRGSGFQALSLPLAPEVAKRPPISCRRTKHREDK